MTTLFLLRLASRLALSVDCDAEIMVHNWRDYDLAGVYGFYEDGVIHLPDHLDPEQFKFTLLHECWHHMGPKDLRTSERLADEFADWKLNGRPQNRIQRAIRTLIQTTN